MLGDLFFVVSFVPSGVVLVPVAVKWEVERGLTGLNNTQTRGLYLPAHRDFGGYTFAIVGSHWEATYLRERLKCCRPDQRAQMRSGWARIDAPPAQAVEVDVNPIGSIPVNHVVRHPRPRMQETKLRPRSIPGHVYGLAYQAHARFRTPVGVGR